MSKWQYTKGLHDLGRGCFAYLQPDGSWGWSNAGLVSDGEQTLLVDTLFDLPQMLKTMISSTARQRVRVKAVTTLTSGHRLRPQRIEAKRNAM
jgi:cyclase